MPDPTGSHRDRSAVVVLAEKIAQLEGRATLNETRVAELRHEVVRLQTDVDEAVERITELQNQLPRKLTIGQPHD